MSFFRSLPILLSIVISSGFWALGVVLIPAEGGSYAALACGEAVPDREIRERLEAQGFTGVVSESGQWVLLDNFGGIERIPLDQYHARVLPLDPRNDGYAEKLRSLFVWDDRRFFYIPLDPQAPAPPAKIEKRLAAALPDIPYSFYAVTGGRPAGLFLVLFCLAAGVFLVIGPIRSAVRPHAAPLIPLLPALVPFALGGAAGFALVSLLSGCAALLAGPCLERFTLPRRRGEPPAICWLLPPLFIICGGFLSLFSGLPPVFILPLFAFFCGMLLFSLRKAYRAAANGCGVWGMSQRRNTGRRRFSPVPILSRRSSPFAFAWAMLPFAAVALVLVCMDIAGSVTKPPAFSALPSAGAVTEADYYTHCRFQSSFSFRSLYAPEQGMAVYELSPDGLLLQHDPVEAEFSPADTPPFPLGDLLRYLDTPRRGRTDTLLSALLPLCFVIPVLVYGRNAGKREGIFFIPNV